MWETIVQIIGPGAVGLVAAGAIAAWFKYRGDKPVTDANASKVQADIVVTFADGWKNLYKEVLDRLDHMEEQMAKQKQEHDKLIFAKNEEIKELKNRLNKAEFDVARLKQEADDLRMELQKYQRIETTTEEARETLHNSVDQSIDQIKSETK